ncbi:MAG: SDR family NAD(P)-dependent oxidoreductase [Mycoplasmoidaceae bacterium]|nr:SDR family NAD(P)-dependent oxidoreductase [Mycoplasmoidaceae bacterium]
MVCCAGVGKFGRYDEICINETKTMIDLNCRSYAMLTEMSIPFMEKGSRIVHIASLAGFQPVPYMTTYAATKAFTISYAQALNQELKSKGISVTCVCPF